MSAAMNDRITDFVLGALSAEERAELVAAARVDPTLDTAIEKMEAMLAPLALSATPVPPPPDLWDRIEAAIKEGDRALDGRTIRVEADAEWLEVAPGIESRRLWNGRTQMLRCAPGAQLVSHLHTGEEHLIILSGDLVIGGRTFVAGDYIGSPRGMDNFTHFTRRGCVLLCQVDA